MQGLDVDCTAGIHIHPMSTLILLVGSVWPECAQHLLFEGMTTGRRQEKEK